MMGLLVLAACTRASTPSEGQTKTTAEADANAEDGERRGVLKLALPAWVAVSVDGRPHASDAEVDVTAGTHALSLQTLCGELEHRVQVAAGGSTRVAIGDVPGLKQAAVQLHVRGKDGKRLDATVTFHDGHSKPFVQGDGWQAAVPGDGQTLEVPACPLRMTVRATKDKGLGAFIEDVDLVDVKPLRREIVLLPGPDLVRIHGGSFVAGPPAEQLEAYKRTYEEYENVRYPVAAFDIDRHEVTAEQYQTCVEAGGCEEVLDELLKTAAPPQQHKHLCNSRRVILDPRTILRQITPGRENHPVDCLAMWEAERYCAWAGKRLPTNVEWEFAARSRKSESKWPWGNDESLCRAHAQSMPREPALCPERDGTAEVCSYPQGNSEQGVCDFVGNVSELAEFPESHRRRGDMSVRGGSYSGMTPPFGISFDLSTTNEPKWRYRQQVSVGFRCARDVEGEAE